jgi:CHASE1-domain containing sensor protein
MNKPREQSRAMKMHGVLLVVGLLFNAAALLLLWWDGARTPYVTNDFSYSADVIVAQNDYDAQKGRFFGVRYNQARLNIQPAIDGDTKKIKTTYGWGEGGAAQSVTKERLVDTLRGTYTDAVANESVLAPRGLEKDGTFYFTPPATDTPLLMQFTAKEVINGLSVLRYSNAQNVPVVAKDGVALKQGESLSSQQTFEMWVEPTSGWLVKYKDTKVLNVLAPNGSVAWPVEYASSVMNPESVDQHAEYAKGLRTKRLFVTQVGPSVFIAIAVFVGVGFGYTRLKRRKTLVLTVGNAVVLAVASVVTIGWIADVNPLKTFFLGTTAMNPISAICFVLVGLAILAKRYGHQRTVVSLGLIIGTVSLLQLLNSLNVISFAPDLLIFGRAVLELDPTMPSRMSSYMSFALLILSSLLVVLGLRQTPPLRFGRFVVALTIMLGFLGVIFNATQIDAVLTMPFIRGLSLVGSCGLIILGVICALLLYGMIGRADNMRYIWRSLRWPTLAAIPVVVIGMFAQMQQRTVQSDLSSEFENRLTLMETAAENRFILHEKSLIGARALLLASQEVTPDEWRDYTVAYDAHPDAVPMKTLGYAAIKSGAAIVQYAEPQTGFVGRDLYADAVIGEALKSAAATGEVRMSGDLAAPPDSGDSQVLVAVPVYEKGASTANEQERLRAIQGYVFGVVDFAEAMRETAASYAEGINFKVYGGTDIEKDMILYAHKLDATDEPRLSKQKTIFAEGQAFTVVYQAEQNFRLSQEQEVSPTAILLGGNAIYFGFLMAMYLLTDMNRQRREYELSQKDKS